MKTLNLKATFGINDPIIPDQATVPAKDDPGPYTPKTDPAYKFRLALLRDVIYWLVDRINGDTNQHLWLGGPTGAGKTSLIMELLARLNMEVITVSGHSELEPEDFLVERTMIGGDLVAMDGPAVTAYRRGAFLLIDEIDQIRPATLVGLNRIADGYPLMLPQMGGEIVHPQPGFGIIATGNSMGCGDDTGLYAGVKAMNIAFMDRFIALEVDYPDTELELDLVKAAAPGLPEDIVVRMMQVTTDVRKRFKANDGSAIGATISVRGLKNWASLADKYKHLKSSAGVNPVVYALERAVLNKTDPVSRTVITEIMGLAFGDMAL